MPRARPGERSSSTLPVSRRNNSAGSWPARDSVSVPVAGVQNAVGHADEHVLADVREKLAVDGGQDVGGGGFAGCDGAQDAAAHRHQQAGGHALAGNIGDRDAEFLIFQIDVVVVVAADDACRQIGAADAEARRRRDPAAAAGCAAPRGRFAVRFPSPAFRWPRGGSARCRWRTRIAPPPSGRRRSHWR